MMSRQKVTALHNNDIKLVDFITGKPVTNIGAEANRQQVERFLVKEKNYLKQDIEVDVDIELLIEGAQYFSQIDLVVGIGGTRVMAIKCAAGSLGSREREILAGARLLGDYQIPLSVVSDGATAHVFSTVTGKKIGDGLSAIPPRDEAMKRFVAGVLLPLPEERRAREMLIFRTYDEMNVNVKRNI